MKKLKKGEIVAYLLAPKQNTNPSSPSLQPQKQGNEILKNNFF